MSPIKIMSPHENQVQPPIKAVEEVIKVKKEKDPNKSVVPQQYFNDQIETRSIVRSIVSPRRSHDSSENFVQPKKKPEKYLTKF
jgi:hypothetical protein